MCKGCSKSSNKNSNNNNKTTKKLEKEVVQGGNLRNFQIKNLNSNTYSKAMPINIGKRKYR